MIGQSMINVNNGAYGRLSGIAASLFLLSFILFGSSWIERIPLAALIGVMFVVCEKTFEWGSFRMIGKVPRADTLVVVLVAAITLVFDLAVAVLAGVVVSALVFAWQHAKQIRVQAGVDAQGWKVYELEGTLFFASVANFNALFAPKDDPQDVVVEFRRARVVDHSAIQAIDALAARYRALGKRLHLRHLSPDCRELLGPGEGHDRGEPAGRPALPGGGRQTGISRKYDTKKRPRPLFLYHLFNALRAAARTRYTPRYPAAVLVRCEFQIISPRHSMISWSASCLPMRDTSRSCAALMPRGWSIETCSAIDRCIDRCKNGFGWPPSTE